MECRSIFFSPICCANRSVPLSLALSLSGAFLSQPIVYDFQWDVNVCVCVCGVCVYHSPLKCWFVSLRQTTYKQIHWVSQSGHIEPNVKCCLPTPYLTVAVPSLLSASGDSASFKRNLALVSLVSFKTMSLDCNLANRTGLIHVWQNQLSAIVLALIPFEINREKD